MTNRLRVALVQTAIQRIEGLEADYREGEADAAATRQERMTRLLRLRNSQNEFGWQFANVKALLEAWQHGESFPDQEAPAGCKGVGF